MPPDSGFGDDKNICHEVRDLLGTDAALGYKFRTALGEFGHFLKLSFPRLDLLS
jgi:hypothetical protein